MPSMYAWQAAFTYVNVTLAVKQSPQIAKRFVGNVLGVHINSLSLS